MNLSIITINYNNAEGLRKTLASVSSQTLLSSKEVDFAIEHVIVDGGSTDGSVEVIKDYERQMSSYVPLFSLVWVSERDKGIYNAMSKGILMSHGEYVQILNSGDCLSSPLVTEQMYEATKEYGDAAILLGNITPVYTDGSKRKSAKSHMLHGQVIKPTLKDFYRGTIPHDAAYIRREVYNCYGLYDEQMKICSDWKLFLQAMVLGTSNQPPLADGQIRYVDVDMVDFDMSGLSERNHEAWMLEKRPVLEAFVPIQILRDYDAHYSDMLVADRLRRHHLYGLVRFLERVLFKLEKWHILKQ